MLSNYLVTSSAASFLIKFCTYMLRPIILWPYSILVTWSNYFVLLEWFFFVNFGLNFLVTSLAFLTQFLLSFVYVLTSIIPCTIFNSSYIIQIFRSVWVIFLNFCFSKFCIYMLLSIMPWTLFNISDVIKIFHSTWVFLSIMC